MLIRNLASTASRMGGLDETEARDWAVAQSEKLLSADNQDFDRLEQLMLNRENADLQWIKVRLR